MQSTDQIDLAGAKVLIVDDIAANLKVLREVLEPRGFRILFAPRGDVALKVARSQLPDLILLDVMMPEMDGFEVCRQLKIDSSTAHIPVIFITAKDEAEDIVKGLRLGGVDYISKPFQTEVVVARTETHLRNSKLAQELRQTNRELEKARDVAEKAKMAQSAFLATMSHEIRTPMNSVLGMTSLLFETALSEEQRDFVETIRLGSRSLLHIINEILDFSKIESGKMTLESHPFNLNASVEEALDLLGPAAAEKNLDLAYSPEPGLPAALLGDSTRLRQILLNLAGNALKFTSRGEIIITVRRAEPERPGADASDCLLHFAVRDTGIGIPREKRDRLFQAFTQVDSSTTRQYGGTGLGLAISKRLTELMEGKMWVESEPGAGSTFHFSIPFKVSANDIAPPAGLPALVGRRVLIIEDNPTNREILCQRLKDWGMVPHGVARATDALASLMTAPPDLIILDLQLPERDGFELAKTIRNLSAGESPALILLSSKALRADDPRLLALGVRSVISKPIRQGQLLNAMKRAADPQVSAGEVPSGRAFDSGLAVRLPLRILLADDHEVNQKVGSRILQGFGYRCEIANNGLEVIQALERQPFDVVFLDVQMPEMDGYETARQIRKRWIDASRPRLIAMTANALLGDREKCLEAGMDDYIAKPIEIADLQKALERCGKPGAHGNAPSHGANDEPPQSSVQTDQPSGTASKDEIDWARLKEMLGVEAGTVREFLNLYFRQTSSQIEQLQNALQSSNAADVEMLAHKCKGASSTCGIKAMVRPMAQLERAAHSGDISNAAEFLAEARESFGRVQKILLEWLKSLEAAANCR
jgi:CheY-like chemotaxis protein